MNWPDPGIPFLVLMGLLIIAGLGVVMWIAP